MQPKRILISLLVVILALLSAGTVVSAEDSPTLDMAVEVSSSTALSDNLCVVDEKGLVTVSVTIKSNPGISMAHFELLFDPEYLQPTVTADGAFKYTTTKIFGASANENVVLSEGKIKYTLQASTNHTETGTVFTCSFVALKHGDTQLSLDMDSKDVAFFEGTNGLYSEEDVQVNIAYGTSTTAKAVIITTHTLGEPTNVPATCTAGGKNVYTCSVCSQTVTVSDGTAKAPHTEVIIPSVPVTCQQDGMTEGKKCSVCGTVTKTPVVAVQKSDDHHTIVEDPAEPATCTKIGKTAGSHCSTCGKVIVARQDVSILGHAYGEYVENADGTKSKTCATCGDVVTENGTGTPGETVGNTGNSGDGDSNTVVIVIVAVAAGLVVGAAIAVAVVMIKKKKVV